jgi:hypothetical protein
MKLLFVFAFLSISTSSICQKGEYLIKNNGDTIWGDINLKSKLFYVTGPSASVIKAEDVARIKSAKYKGAVVVPVNLLTYTDNLANLELDYIEKGAIDTVLILNEIYISPKINLYYVTDANKVPFYFYKTPADPRPVQLIIRYHLEGGFANYIDNRPRYRGERSRVQIVEDKGYVNQLFAIMGNCKKITEPMWELLSYRNYSLKQIAKKFNQCD